MPRTTRPSPNSSGPISSAAGTVLAATLLAVFIVPVLFVVILLPVIVKRQRPKCCPRAVVWLEIALDGLTELQAELAHRFDGLTSSDDIHTPESPLDGTEACL